MHIGLGVATVTTPTQIFSNAYVEIDSVDDVVATARIANRQGVTLELVSGPFEATTPGTWVLHTETGDVIVHQEPQGCGCGGTSVSPVMDEGQVMP